MPALFLELFSEEIPSMMQAQAANDLSRLLTESLKLLSPTEIQTWYGPRRIAFAAQVSDTTLATSCIERGPRVSAPEQALIGFLRKHCIVHDQLKQHNGYWILEKIIDAVPAASLIADNVPSVLCQFPWPKSMRWGVG